MCVCVFVFEVASGRHFRLVPCRACSNYSLSSLESLERRIVTTDLYILHLGSVQSLSAMVAGRLLLAADGLSPEGFPVCCQLPGCISGGGPLGALEIGKQEMRLLAACS